MLCDIARRIRGTSLGLVGAKGDALSVVLPLVLGATDSAGGICEPLRCYIARRMYHATWPVWCNSWCIDWWCIERFWWWVQQTRLEILRASEMPAHLRPRVAPPHAQPAVCCVTGVPHATFIGGGMNDSMSSKLPA